MFAARRIIKAASIHPRLFSSSAAPREHFLSASAETFEAKVMQSSDRIVIVDFYADWCGPCKVLTPVLKSTIPATSPTYDLVTIDTDAETALAQEYSIRSLPTVMAFKNGEPIGKFVGAVGPAGVQTFLDGLK